MTVHVPHFTYVNFGSNYSPERHRDGCEMVNENGNQGPDFQFHIDEDGICALTVSGEFVANMAHAIAQRVQAAYNQGLTINGILLDMREAERLSMIRLSSLIDMLSHYQTPIAVVLQLTQQQRLASLLHQTLSYREHIAYFTRVDGARLFLEKNNPAG